MSVTGWYEYDPSTIGISPYGLAWKVSECNGYYLFQIIETSEYICISEDQVPYRYVEFTPIFRYDSCINKNIEGFQELCTLLLLVKEKND